jgi:hypothetical protein
MSPPGTLAQKDRLLVEIPSQLLVKQGAGTTKLVEIKQLTSILSGFQSPSRSPVPAPNTSEPQPELTAREKFARDDDEDQRRAAIIREEMNRRKDAGPLPGQTAKEFEYYRRWHEIGIDLTKQHGWQPLYVD